MSITVRILWVTPRTFEYLVAKVMKVQRFSGKKVQREGRDPEQDRTIDLPRDQAALNVDRGEKVAFERRFDDGDDDGGAIGLSIAG